MEGFTANATQCAEVKETAWQNKPLPSTVMLVQ